MQGISLFQRACTSLYRAEKVQSLEELLTTLQSDKNRSNDTIFLASLLRKTEVLPSNDHILWDLKLTVCVSLDDSHYRRY